MSFSGSIYLLLFAYLTGVVSLVLPSFSNADDITYPVECLYDSVYICLKPDYTGEVIFNQQFLFNQSAPTEYSIIKICVNKYVEFCLIGITTVLPDGRHVDLDKDDIETVSDFGPRYYPDSKTKILRIPSTKAGAVSTVSYRLKYKSLLYLQQFFRQRNIPTFNSWLEVSSNIPYTYFVPASYFLSILTDSTIAFWSSKIPAYTEEVRMPPVESYRIVIRPDSVVYEGHKYGFKNWSDVAAFYSRLSRGRQKPDIKVAALAESLCANATNKIDSIEALFDFVKENIRYVSVDVGRGEFKPLLAVDVLNKRYGDCKDQSTLLTYLCQAVGLKANPALTTTRDRPDILVSLPWPGYFNHVITAVDTSAGYLFLDASQTTCCFGRLPPELRNRRALICGTEPFLDFTLTYPYDKGNILNFDLTYNVISGSEVCCNVKIRIYNDPAFELYAEDPEKVLVNLLGTFLSNTETGRYRSNFKVVKSMPGYIEMSGYFFENLSVPSKSNWMLIKTHSAFIEYLRRYFAPPGRKQPYAFDFTFNINEIIRIKPADGYIIKRSSVNSSFDEQGLVSQVSLTSGEDLCIINKDFMLLNHTLSPEIYNKFYNFLLMVSQVCYNSVEVKVE